MSRVRAIPATQWMVTHANWIPRTGKNAVTNSVNMEVAMSQWNVRDDLLWRSTRDGRDGASCAAVFGLAGAKKDT